MLDPAGALAMEELTRVESCPRPAHTPVHCSAIIVGRALAASSLGRARPRLAEVARRLELGKFALLVPVSAVAFAAAARPA